MGESRWEKNRDTLASSDPHISICSPLNKWVGKKTCQGNTEIYMPVNASVKVCDLLLMNMGRDINMAIIIALESMCSPPEQLFAVACYQVTSDLR